MAANLPLLKIVIKQGPQAGQVFIVQGPAQTIGRGSSNTIIIPDNSLSRQHAQIRATANGYIIEDLGSTNGTFVNEKQVTKSVPIRPGDTLRLGHHVTCAIELQPGAATDFDATMAGKIGAAGPASAAVPGKSAPGAAVVTPKPKPVTGAFEPQSPPMPVQLQSSKAAWIWVGVAIIIALLIVGGALGYIYYTTQPPVPATEIAADTPTLIPTDTPLPTNTPPPEATPTPEPINVPGVAVAAAQQQALPPDIVEIDPFCETQIEITTTDAVALHWTQPLAPPNAEANYPAAWLKAAYYDLTIDGRPINAFNYYQEDSSLNFWHNLGLLAPGTHFIRIQVFTNREVSSGLDLAPSDGQVDLFGPGPAGEGACEIVVAEPIAAATATLTAEPTEEPTVTLTPSPTSKVQPTALPPAPLGIFQDFEAQSTWKRGDQPYGEFTRSSGQVYSGSYAGQLSYNFPSPDNDYVVFLQSRSLAGRPNAISAWVYGDGSGHFLNLWLKDAAGQSWAMSFGQVKHTGWQEMTAFIDPGQPWPSGHISGPDNGAIDYPISFQALVLDDSSDNYRGRGVIYIDDLNSQEGAAPPTPTPAPAAQTVVVQPAGPTPAPAGGPYVLAIGSQHRYEEPWGAPAGGDPCAAWRDGKWDDKNANFRGFNVEVLFTNNSASKVPDNWGENMRFYTSAGQEVRACYYGYGGAGPAPQGTTSLTFFSVVPKGDYVQSMRLDLNGQFTQLCLDGRGGWSRC